MTACPTCGQDLPPAPPEPFSFTEMRGRHHISVTGVRAEGRVKIAIRCDTCQENLLTSSDATEAQAIAAVENHA